MRTGREVGSLGLCRPGPESRQPGRDEENFPRGLLRSYPHPASVPPRRRGRDRGRPPPGAEDHASQASVQIRNRSPHPHPLPPTPALPPTSGRRMPGLQPCGRGGGRRLTPAPPSRWCRAGTAVEAAAESRRAGPVARALPGSGQSLTSSAPAAHLRAPCVTDPLM